MSGIRFDPPIEPSAFTLAAEVFGLTRGKVPKNYVERASADYLLQSAIARRQHIVIHGSSKQGKTSLRRRHLPTNSYIEITCLNAWTVEDLHRAILTKAGYSFPVSEATTDTSENKFGSKKSIKVKASEAVELGIDRDRSSGHTHQRQRSFAPPSVNLADVNDVIEALLDLDFDRTVILEDFHYLKVEVQAEFSIALKGYFDTAPNLLFVIVGVWLDKHRLVQYNGDLAGRMEAIDADTWTRESLAEVIGKGERLLDLKFDSQFKLDLLDNCLNSVWIVQEVCYRACSKAGVLGSWKGGEVVGVDDSATDYIRDVVDASSARFSTFISEFSNGLNPTELELHRWILGTVLYSETDSLHAGIPIEELKTFIESHHPVGKLNRGHLRKALGALGALQAAIHINPMVLDYDQGANRLNIVDRAFPIWLRHQDKEMLLQQAGLPDELVRSWTRENIGPKRFRMAIFDDGSRKMMPIDDECDEPAL